MNKSQNNDNQTEQNLQLTDLAPQSEVKGGIVVLEYLVLGYSLSNPAPAPTSSTIRR
jgi:hypothetical protein